MGKKVKIVLDIEAHFEGKITFYGRVVAKGTVFFLQNSMSLLTNSISGNSVFFLSKTHKKKCGKVYKAQQGTNPPTYGVFE